MSLLGAGQPIDRAVTAISPLTRSLEGAQPYSERVRCHATTLRLQIQHDGAALSGT